MSTKLSNTTMQALVAAELAKAQAYAQPYVGIAKKAAQTAAEGSAASTQARKARESLWGTFKTALSAAQAAGHSPATMRLGLEIACTDAEVPGGSFRSYVATLADLLGDIQNGKLALSEAEGLSIGDARKRYRVVTPYDASVARLMDAIKDWTPEEVQELVMLASGEGNEDVALELVTIGTKHAEERQGEEEAAASVKQAA